ncbi:hypothetical protein PTSG_05397 [Salpingoeca rosetta]|uniref:DUF2062 domain-containing protein n=1 Tax=Salpingoeca rosetta (strain ATCC 50818 / BSB-021) TaxID=946362 RepID=F2UAB4_SALR5|nr:uncharacterized protein PTSG_05397 [Salpingoeca rosetta]EGD73689.1 hypothetical protein PTSG_05397 [Salpingoeca rosetta]|eukprot:XP_004993970.1 hypothetical protein PTSG_05397 [Salpingoeca rosetta]
MFGKLGRKLATFARRVRSAFLELSVHQIGIAVAVGIVGGFFPIPGLTTLPCLLLSTLGRLPTAGHIVVQALNLALAIPNLVTVPHFACFGEALWHGQLFSFHYRECIADTVAVVAQAKDAPVATIQRFAIAFLLGALAWAIVFLPVMFPFAYYTSTIVARFLRKHGSHPASSSTAAATAHASAAALAALSSSTSSSSSTTAKKAAAAAADMKASPKP